MHSPARLLIPYAAGLAGVLALVLMTAAAEAIGLILLSALLAVVAGAAPANHAWPLELILGAATASPARFLIALGGVYIARSVLALWTNFHSISLAFRMADDWRIRLIRGYLAAPLRNLTRQQGSMVQIVLDEPSVVGIGLASGGLLAQNAVSAATLYAALLVLSPLLTLGLTAMALVAGVAVFALSQVAQKIALERSRAYSVGYAYITELLSAVKQIRLFNIESTVEREAAESLSKMRRPNRASNVLASSPRLVIEVIFMLGLGSVLAVLLRTMSGSAALSQIGLVVAATFRLLPSLTASAGTWLQLQQAWPALVRINNELNELEAIEVGTVAGLRRKPMFLREVIVDGVHFGYPMRGEALKGIDLKIARGQFVGIIGPSGSGKSTLVDLLCGFYTPDGGRILIDETDLRSIDAKAWREMLGVVAQDSFLFTGTIRDNITLLRRHATEKEIDQVAEIVGADQFIRALPEGYRTRVGERGVALSGGQRQRLALARVLLKRPEVLILDEATSALDGESDEAFQRQLLKYRGVMTVIAVTHRLTSVRRADCIYVLSDGRIVEYGSHNDLVRLGRTYAALWRQAQPNVV